MSPFGDAETMTTVMGTNRLDSVSLSSQCCAFRRTHTGADPIRLICIRLPLPLILSLPSRFAPNAGLMFYVPPWALWLAGDFSCDYMFWNEGGGELTGQSVGPLVATATITAIRSTNRVHSRSLSSRCCTLRRTHASSDSIRVIYVRLALPLTLSLPSAFAASERLPVGVPPRALWLAGVVLRRKRKYVRV